MAEKKESTEVKEATAEEKSKICFVIMPISDVEGYDAGHFKRVYDHIIKPACLNAGFEPLRADDINKTNHIIIDILKQIIEADMCICDLSGRNPNVLYELGIRQAFNFPVTLIKDERTSRIFDIQTLRDVPYDSSLRIDKIEQAIPEITSALQNTYDDKVENINSITQLLGIESAKITKTEVSNDTTLLLDAISGISRRLNTIEDKTRLSSLRSFSDLQNTIERINFTILISSEEDLEADKKQIRKIIQTEFPEGTTFATMRNDTSTLFRVRLANPISHKISKNLENILRANYSDRLKSYRPILGQL